MTDSQFKTSSISSVVAATFSQRIISLQNRRAPLLSVLPKRPLGSNSYNWTMETSGSTAGIISEGGSFGNAASDALIKATASTIIFKNTFMVSDTVMKVAALGTNPAGVAEFTRQLENSVSAMMGGTTGIAPYLFDGDGDGEPWGLDVVIDLANSPYGIDQTSNALFRGNVIDGTSDAGYDGYFSLDMIDEGFEKTFTASGTKPDLLVVSAKTARMMAKKQESIRTLVSQTAQIQTAAGIIMPGGAYGTYNGVPILIDQHCDDDVVFGLNTEFVYVGFLPQTTDMGLASAYLIDSAIDDRSGVQSLPITLTPLGRDSAAQKWAIQTDLALIVESPSTCFKVHNFSHA